jgi:DNA-binding NtrC family response regulator
MSKPVNLLIVDDEPNIRRILQAAFQKQGYNVHTAEGGKQALSVVDSEPIDAVICDVIMPDIHGTELLKTVRTTHPDLVFVMMTAFGTIPQAVDAMRMGAFDYMTKPFDLEMLKKVVARGIEARAKRNAASPTTTTVPKGKNGKCVIIGESPKMKELMTMVDRVADARATVLISGESGTGKELIARALYERSSRADKPFVAISCAALPETLLESELFGHEKGAFTGATGQKPGRFELAHQGTLFLDEIGDVPPVIQIKLLRVLQEREFERLGGTKPLKVDVRMIAATNRDLEEAVAAGQFRADLFYRLQVVQICLPPLRERKEDIPTLCEHFIAKYNTENSRNLKSIAPAALDALIAYKWPGNIRELENTIERAVVLAPDDAHQITPDLLPPHIAV